MKQPGALILHPVVLAALAVWALNDHVLKAYGGWLPGKLSDVACLIVIPVMLPSAIELWRSRRGAMGPATGWVVGCALVAAAIMVAINVSSSAAWIYEHGMGALQWPFRTLWGRGYSPVQLTMDPSDVLTLPAALVPIVLARRRSREGRRLFVLLRSFKKNHHCTQSLASRQESPTRSSEAPKEIHSHSRASGNG